MNFKTWFVIAENLDDQLKNILLKSKYGEATPQEIQTAVNQLEKEYQDKIGPDKATAFRFMQKIFSLKNKQNKETPTDPFLATYYNRLKNKEIFPEEYKTLLYFQKENKELLTEMMDSLRTLITENKIKLIFTDKPKIRFKNEILENYNDFTQFLGIIHSIQSQLQEVNIDKYQNPAFLEMTHKADLVAKGDNIWVFKGDDPMKCRIMGQGQSWCISSSSAAQHYINYRHDYGQTQYFIFDFNKAPDDPARYVNPGVAPDGQYSEWVDRRNTHPKDDDDVAFGVNGYNSLKEYLAYLKSKGIDITVFKADPLTKEEQTLRDILMLGDLENARNYKDNRKAKNGMPLMLYWFLKLSNSLDDEDFIKLSEQEKEEFLLGKRDITPDQIDYILDNPKLIAKYIKSRDGNMANLITASKMTKNIDNLKKIENAGVEITSDAIAAMITPLGNSEKFDLLKMTLQKLGPKYIDKLNPKNIGSLIANQKTENIPELIQLLGKNSLDKLNSKQIAAILHWCENFNQMVKELGPDVLKKLTKEDILSAAVATEDMFLLSTEEIINKSINRANNLIRFANINQEEKKYIIDKIKERFSKRTFVK